MKKKVKKFSIKKNNQKYLKILLNNYPKISSGRKNYESQYKRVLINILLTKAYNFLLKYNK